MKFETPSIKKIELLKKQIDAFLPLNGDDEKKLKKKFRLEFNYNSNHLEGNTLTYGQTQLLLFYDKSSGDVPVSDIEEMKAHDVALSQIEEMAKDKERPLTEQFIKELNKIILVKPYWRDAETYDKIPTRKKIEIGTYKTTPNSVRLKNGEIHEYASPAETPAKMNDLMVWYNENVNEMHPVQLAAEFHYCFVCIHPFDDGNGRVARLLMNYIILKNEYPPVIIKSEDKENYLTALQKADIGDLIALIEYIENQLIWSLELKLKAAKGEDIEELGDIEKEINILKREKLTKSKIYKTPKVSYDLINHINDDLWKPLLKVLNKFDDFFAETKTCIYVNNSKLVKKEIIRRAIGGYMHLFEDKEVLVQPYKIFDHDLEKENISEISWERNMLSLKSALKKIDYFINCNLILKEASYQLIISESDTDTSSILKNRNILFEEEKEYKSYFMNDDIEKVIRLTSNHLIKVIKG